jgi:hypothetical protein
MADTGNNLATGINDITNVLSVQTAVCESTKPCQASNSLSEKVSQKDIAAAPPANGSNGAGGKGGNGGAVCVGVCASSGQAYANATPTPLPTDEGLTYYTIWTYYTYWTYGFAGGGGGGGGGAAGPGEYLPWGHYVLVDMWGRDPSRRLPPMPGQKQVKSPGRVVTLESPSDGWPGVDALPLPDLVPSDTDVTEAAPAPASALVRGGSGTVAAPAAVTAAAPAAATDDAPPPDGTIVDLDLWGADKDVANLPQPDQAARQAAPAVLAIDPGSLAVPIVPAASGSSGTASGPPAVQYALGALGGLLAALGGIASATQRGRFWMLSRRAALAGLLASSRAALAGFVGGGRSRVRLSRAWIATQGIRTLAILRLTIGLFGLRLW